MCVRVSKESQKSVKCVSNVMTPKMVEKWIKIKSVSECQKESQMCVTRIDIKNGRKMNQDQISVRVSKRESIMCPSVGKLFVSEMSELLR